MLNNTQFTDLIGKINKSTSERRSDIQEALVFAACIAQRDRNVDPVIRLFAVIGNETNRTAIAHWLSANAPVFFKEDMAKLSDKRQKEFDGTMEEFEADLRNQPEWHKYATKSNAAENIWDGAEKFDALRKYITNMEKQAKDKKDDKLLEVLVAVHATLNNHQYK